MLGCTASAAQVALKGSTTLAGSMAGLVLRNSVALPYLQVIKFKATDSC